MLENKQAVGLDNRCTVSGQSTNGIEAVAARDQGEVGFSALSHQCSIGGSDVRWIGHDDPK